MDNPEDLIYCSYCGKPTYDGDSTMRSPRHEEVLHMECFLKVFKAENVTIETDENGDAYYRIEIDEDD